MDSLVYKAETLIERRDTEALPFANKLMAMAEANNNAHQLAQANYVLAYYNCTVANAYKKAIEICEATIQNTSDDALKSIDYKMHMTLGNAYQFKGEIFSAQHWYMKGIKLLEDKVLDSNKEKLFLAAFYYNLSVIYTTRQLNDSGEDYLKKAIELYEQAGSVFKLSKCYSAYADILEGRKEYDKAIELMQKALALDMQGNDLWSIAISQANLGILYSRNLLFNQAVDYLQKSLEYFVSENKQHETALVQFNLGRVLCSAGKIAKGITLLNKAKEIFARLNNKHELTNVYELLSSTMAQKGDYKKALEYYHQYADNVKYVFDSEKANALTRAKQEFETEQREKEALLLREKNEEIQIYALNLQAANKSLEALTYSVSHDLKVPLAMIKNINSMQDADNNGYKQFIDETCKQALNSIDGIISFSESINNNQLSAEYVSTNVFELLKNKLNELQRSAKLNNQTLHFVQNDKNITARINPETFGRAIANLVSNAIKFSHAGGNITVEVVKETEATFTIKVIDNGIGIPGELRQHIFKKHSAAQREGLKGEKSTGLGLYITHTVIGLHGGTIALADTEDNGTTFIIKLPLA